MDYEEFKIIIFKICGINLSLYKEKQMKRRIDSLIKKNNYEGYDDYSEALKTNKILYIEFVNYLTINVSEFYRNPEQWDILERDILPIILEKTKTPKIWSSACSTGDEPFTLVMVLNKFLPLEKIHIVATDIDKEAIAKAQIGIYNKKSLENLPKVYRDKYFTPMGELYKINDNIKKCVEFRQMNLHSDPYPGDNDLVVCRNVLIYFTEEAKYQIYVKFNKALKTGGILFVGSTEQIIMANKFNLKSIKTFFYKKEGNL